LCHTNVCMTHTHVHKRHTLLQYTRIHTHTCVWYHAIVYVNTEDFEWMRMYGWNVMSQVWKMRMSHVTHVNAVLCDSCIHVCDTAQHPAAGCESWLVYTCGMTHLSLPWVTWSMHQCDMSLRVPWLIHMCDMTHSCAGWLVHTCHTFRSHVTHVNGSCHTHARVMSKVSVVHTTHIHESCHTYA